MNYKNYCVLDFETTGVNPATCQPIQLAALMVDGRKLEVIPGSLFVTFIKPELSKEKCLELGFDEMNDKCTEVTHITMNDLKDAPEPKIAWKLFEGYMQKYNVSKSKWNSSIKCGYNIKGYDNEIIDRLTGGHRRYINREIEQGIKAGVLPKDFKKMKEPYGFGPFDYDRFEETLFAPRDCLDVLDFAYLWFENNPNIKSLSLDSIREYLGISKEGAHRGDKDCKDTALILIKMLKLHRAVSPTVKFKDSCKDVEIQV